MSTMYEAAVEWYRTARDEWMRLTALEDAAFARYFAKRQAGEPTNGAAVQRIGNRANYASAEMFSAQSALYKLDLDPHDFDKADGVEPTPIGGNAYS